MVKKKTIPLKFFQEIFKKFPKAKVRKVIYIFLTLLAVGFLIYRFRDKFLAGVVNNEPIFRLELSSRLNSQYGKTVLEDLIVEKLILQGAKTKGINVSDEELKQAVEKIKSQLGENADLDSLLSLQGMKKADFERQLEIQLLVKKLMESQLTVSKEEINSYIKDNKKQMTATKEAEMVLEATQKIKDEKISTELNSWISDLLKKAKIIRLIP